MLPKEAVYIFGLTIIEPLMLRIYGLPSKSIEYVFSMIDLAVDAAVYGYAYIKHVYETVQNIIDL
jgi:hypothetical protein